MIWMVNDNDDNGQKLFFASFSCKGLQDLLLLANEENQVNDEEFLLLFDLNGSRNLVFPYWKYNRFNLDELENDECKAKFRFEKEDIYTLRDVLQLPARIICCNGTNVSSL